MWQHTKSKTEWLMMAFSWLGILLLFGKITHCVWISGSISNSFLFFQQCLFDFSLIWFVSMFFWCIWQTKKILLFFCPFENHVLDHQHPYFSIVLLLLQQCIIWSILVAIILNTEKKKKMKKKCYRENHHHHHHLK